MTEERRYQEDEVSEIFALATTEGAIAPALPHQDGLTLGELQAVGTEIGVAPERVADAAASLDARAEVLPRETFLSSPVTAGRVVELPRGATDREWQFLVAELRETFGAKGQVSSHAGVREWSNGNLHAVLEEAETGHRLRLGTRKGNVMEIAGAGSAVGGMGIILFLIMIGSGKTGPEMLMPMAMALGGLGAVARTVLALPKWAGERDRQMEHVAAKARALLAAHPVDEDAAP